MIHVTYRKDRPDDRKWVVLQDDFIDENNNIVSLDRGYCRRKILAVNLGKHIAKSFVSGGVPTVELVIHGKSGIIQKKHTYGLDPKGGG